MNSGYSLQHNHPCKKKKKEAAHWQHTATATFGESFASKAGLALLEGKERILGSALYALWGQSGEKKADCWAQFDDLLLGMGSPLPD